VRRAHESPQSCGRSRISSRYWTGRARIAADAMTQPHQTAPKFRFVESPIRIVVLFSLCIGVALSHAEAQERIGIDIFGASYHYQGKEYFDDDGKRQDFKALNPGLGLVATLRTTARSVVEVHGAVYRASVNKPYFVTAVTWQVKLPLNLRLGGALALFGDLVGGNFAVGPIPVIGWSRRRVALTAVWLPSQDPNTSSAVGTFATFYLR